MKFLFEFWVSIMLVAACLLMLTKVYPLDGAVSFAEGTVLMVGGCDKHGWCKVMMEDGAMGMVAYPVTGQHCRYQVEK